MTAAARGLAVLQWTGEIPSDTVVELLSFAAAGTAHPVVVDSARTSFDIVWIKRWPVYFNRVGVQQARSGQEQDDLRIRIDLPCANQALEPGDRRSGFGRYRHAFRARKIPHRLADLLVTDRNGSPAAGPDRRQDQVVTDGRGHAQARGHRVRVRPGCGSGITPSVGLDDRSASA